MRYRRNPDVVFSDVDDRLMMMNPVHAEFVTLSPTGSAVWHALDEPGSPEDLVERLRAAFPDGDSVTMRREVEAFLEQLLDTGVVQQID